MSETKWHKKCGGKVVYREPEKEGAGFEQAGMCLKCDSFPIYEENIIFKISEEKVERFYEDTKLWWIVKKEEIPENLDK